jgi:hypothetical protein
MGRNDRKDKERRKEIKNEGRKEEGKKDYSFTILLPTRCGLGI